MPITDSILRQWSHYPAATASVLDTAEIHHFFRIIDGQADHMLDLISDLLDVARIEAGALSVSPEPVDAAILVDLARNTFLSGERGSNNIQIDIPPDLPRVMTDRRRIVQLLGSPNFFLEAGVTT